MTGRLLGAAGAVEAIATVLALEHGVMPPTINYRSPDPECDLDYVPNQARHRNVGVALSNSFGFGGVNATLVFKRPDACLRRRGVWPRREAMSEDIGVADRSVAL